MPDARERSLWGANSQMIIAVDLFVLDFLSDIHEKEINFLRRPLKASSPEREGQALDTLRHIDAFK